MFLVTACENQPVSLMTMHLPQHKPSQHLCTCAAMLLEYAPRRTGESTAAESFDVIT